MPTYYRPRIAHVDPGGADVGGLVLVVAAVAGVVAFVLAHLVVVAVCVGVLVAVPVGSALAMRRLIQPRGIRRWLREQELSARRVPQPGGVVQVPGLVLADPDVVPEQLD